MASDKETIVTSVTPYQNNHIDCFSTADRKWLSLRGGCCPGVAMLSYRLYVKYADNDGGIALDMFELFRYK